MEEGENQRWEDVRFPSYTVVSVDLGEGKSVWKLKWRTVLKKLHCMNGFDVEYIYGFV